MTVQLLPSLSRHRGVVPEDVVGIVLIHSLYTHLLAPIGQRVT
jgi:hypothetical protein